MGRSNINLVGNTTQGQNLGSGECVFKAKGFGNIMQYKTLSVTGTTMSITSDGDNIYFSAATGGGGSTGETIGWATSGATGSTVIGCGTPDYSEEINYTTIIGTCAGMGGIAIGNRALANHNELPATNIAIGNLSQCATTSGNHNISLGHCSLCAGSNVAQNVAIGNNTLASATAVYDNVAIGLNTLRDNASGGQNTVVGSQSMCDATGGQNSVFGAYAMRGLTTGVGNVAAGYEVGNLNITGCYNVLLGYKAGYYETGSHKLHIGNETGCTLIYGEFDNKLVCIDDKLSTCQFQMTSGATNGYFLCSDAEGNGVWATGGGGGISWNGSTANAIATYIDSSTVCAESGLTYNGGVVCNAGDLTIETDDASCIFLHAPTVAGDCNHIGLGKPTMASGIDINRIVSEGQASNIDIQIWSKGTGYIYLAAPTTYIGGVSTTGLQYTTATKSLQVGVAGKFSSKGGNSGTPDGSDICIVGAAPYAQTGFGGDGGGICICGGNAGSGTGHVAAVDGGHVTLKGGLAVNGGANGRIIMSGLPGKTSETCGLYIDASGNLSTGVISGGTGGGLDAYSALTYSATVVWDTSVGLNKTLSTSASFILSLTNLSNGMSGDLRLNVTSGPITITLPASKLNGIVTNIPAGIYHLTWIYDGSNLDFNMALYA